MADRSQASNHGDLGGSTPSPPTSTFNAVSRFVHDAASEQKAQIDAAVDRVCEQALVAGHGVLVTERRDGSVSVAVSRLVPYGELQYARG